MNQNAKRILAVLISTSLAFILFGCNSDGKTEPEAEIPATIEPGLNGGMDTLEPVTVQLVSNPNGLLESAFAQTDEGCYMYFQKPAAANILYLDFETQQRIYLSNQVNTTHDDETDTSYYGNLWGGSSIFIAGDKLYVIQLGSPIMANYYGDDGRGKIYQCDLNGANRKTAIMFEDYEDFVLGSSILFDGENIYILMISYELSDASINMLKINVTTGERSTVISYPDNAQYYLIGGVSSKAVVQIKKTPNDDFYKQENTLCLVDVRNGKETPIYEWTGPVKFGNMYENEYVCTDASTGNILKVSMDDGAETILVEKFFTPGDIAYPIAEIFDNRMFFKVYDALTGEGALYGVHLKTGDLAECTLLNDQGQPLGVFAESSEYFMVNKGETIIQIEDKAEGQATIIVNSPQVVYALIEKDDYWNNIPNFIPIDDYAFG